MTDPVVDRVAIGRRETIAVGTALSGGPPHRSPRALLTLWAPALGASVEARVWEGVHDTDLWQPSCR